jgi:hypothetical protein
MYIGWPVLSAENKSQQKLLDLEIMNAWRNAAEELGIRVEIPFTLTANNGETISYEAHVVDFGGPNGTVFGTLQDESRFTQRRRDAGYFASDIGPSYRTYNRQLFIDTLDDWKWFGGKGQEPPWYSGKNWS